MLGKCKLCLREAVELQQSHFLPAGIYRTLRDDAEQNPNPWLITKKSAVQTSRQTKARLLCRECEQRFSANGENWVFRYCLKPDRTFPLAAILEARTPDVFSPQHSTKVYFASQIPDVNISALSYFAASMFWRASVYGWNEDGSIPVDLGPFGESFRQYLLDLAYFPPHCALWVSVRQGKEIDRLTHEPMGERKGQFHAYNFPMPGLGFSLMVGKHLPAVCLKHCFVRGAGNPITVTEVIEKALERRIAQLGEHSLGHKRAVGRK